MKAISKSLKETAEIAIDFGSKLESKKEGALVVGLYGELGAGKTTFMKYLAESFGIKETIQSPTFVIMKRYQLQSASRETLTKNSRLAPSVFELLIHIDAYRVEKEEEMLNLGWREIIADPKSLVCVEWPERISDIMPPHIKIFFEHVSENERKIKIET